MSDDEDDNCLTFEQYQDLCRRFKYLPQTKCFEWEDIRPALEFLSVPLAGHELRELVEKPQKTMSLEEFAELYSKAKDMKDTSKSIKKALLLSAIKDVEPSSEPNASGVRHTVSKAEERGFTIWINDRMEKDQDLTNILPIDTTKDGQLYERCRDGILLCKLVNVASPNTIDERSINKEGALKNVFNLNENLTLAINSAAAIGCCVVNTGPDDILKKKRHIVLGLIWQLIRKGLVDTITLSHHKELLALLQGNESIEDLMQLKPEELLMRWVNYHLARTNCTRRMTNYTSDVQDSEIYAYLISQICPVDKRDKLIPTSEIMACSDPYERATMVLQNADMLDAQSFLTPEDICQSDDSRERLHLGFLATLFNMYPTIEVSDEVEISNETLEERTYRNWMNSLGVRPYVSYLDVDLSNGLVLLQLIDIIEPHSVDWSLVTEKFERKKKLFQEQANCNLVVSTARDINIRFVNVSGEDIREGNKKLILGVVFQLMHAYITKMLRQAAGEAEEKDVIVWANEKLTSARAMTVSGFRDPAFATGVPILQILEKIKPGSTKKSIWLDGTGDDFSICTYAISCCRKAGATIYALPEHLRDLNGKMIHTILIALQTLSYKSEKKQEEKGPEKRKSKLSWLTDATKNES